MLEEDATLAFGLHSMRIVALSDQHGFCQRFRHAIS